MMEHMNQSLSIVSCSKKLMNDRPKSTVIGVFAILRQDNMAKKLTFSKVQIDACYPHAQFRGHPMVA